ncbi:unnamed protein product, partial [Polarella glacialis]
MPSRARHQNSWPQVWLARLVAVQVLSCRASVAPEQWRDFGKEALVDYLLSIGCEDCVQLLGARTKDLPFTLSSHVFGCADIDVLLPSMHWLYEGARRQNGGIPPGLLVDGGANVGRATARWIAALGDSFGRRMSRNKTQAPCIICAGAGAAEGGGSGGAAVAVPTVAVVAVEPSPSNFALLQRHASESGWDEEGFLAIQAALSSEAGHADLAVSEDFAVDEVATLLYDAADTRARTRVQVVTLND